MAIIICASRVHMHMDVALLRAYGGECAQPGAARPSPRLHQPPLLRQALPQLLQLQVAILTAQSVRL